jgi:hypothetical protein
MECCKLGTRTFTLECHEKPQEYPVTQRGFYPGTSLKQVLTVTLTAACSVQSVQFHYISHNLFGELYHLDSKWYSLFINPLVKRLE